MKLLTEITEDIQIIKESEGKTKNYFIEGVFLQSDIENGNHRIYPKEVMVKEVLNYTNKYINQSRALGELGHPDGPNINLDRVSHKILSLKEDGNNFIGRAKILSTPMGLIAQNLISEGVKLGVSSRALGDLNEKNGVTYVTELRLFTAADIVANPSAPDAFVRGLMESKEWVWQNGLLIEKDLHEIKTTITKASSRKLNEAKIKAFECFMKKLSK